MSSIQKEFQCAICFWMVTMPTFLKCCTSTGEGGCAACLFCIVRWYELHKHQSERTGLQIVELDGLSFRDIDNRLCAECE